MRHVDAAMLGEFAIDLPRMMENAGRNTAEVVIRRFTPESATVLAGTGGNGGGGLVAARHLWNRGVHVSVTVSHADRLGPVPRHQLDIVRRIGIPVVDDPPDSEVVVDALIAYSLSGAPRDRVADLIRWSNGKLVVALDTPSGLDVTTGRAFEPCVEAAATVTLALPKVGLMDEARVGELYLADISIPPTLYERYGAALPFEESAVIRLR